MARLKEALQVGASPQPGLKLRSLCRGHHDVVNRIVWSPEGNRLASASRDGRVRIWSAEDGSRLFQSAKRAQSITSIDWSSKGCLAWGGYDEAVHCREEDREPLLWASVGSRIDSLAFSPRGTALAVGLMTQSVLVLDAERGDTVAELKGHLGAVYALAWLSEDVLASGDGTGSIIIWSLGDGGMVRELRGHSGSVYGLSRFPDGIRLASSSWDSTVRIWDADLGKEIQVLESHTGNVSSVSISADGRVLASKSIDDTVRIWSCETWEAFLKLPEPSGRAHVSTSLAFHPKAPALATLGQKDTAVRIWDLDVDVLLGARPVEDFAHYTVAKVVIVGESGVGKTGLGWKLAHGEFKEHSSTHGQQFWLLKRLSHRRRDGTECEAILWDLAGQPDYRLIHGLFLDDADLALVLFDSADSHDPLRGVDFWLNSLHHQPGGRPCRIILVGARCDRGDPKLTVEDIEEFCRDRGIEGRYVRTSARTGEGIDKLIARMTNELSWDEMSATTTTATFKRIKEIVLELKESPETDKVLVDWAGLRERLEKHDPEWRLKDDEMTTAIGHLAKHGYVRTLRDSKGGEQVLLAPELLNNLAASMVLAARGNPKGLGALEEKRLLRDDYPFRELDGLAECDRETLRDAAAVQFLEHHICFRETTLSGDSFLIFPELINLRKPRLADEVPTVDDVSYTVSGAIENVYATLVVLLGYTNTFTRTDQWQNQAQYEIGGGLICGFRQHTDPSGALDFVLYYGTDVDRSTHRLFSGLFESILAQRSVTVVRHDPLVCTKCGNTIQRQVVINLLKEGKESMICYHCGQRLTLPKPEERVTLSDDESRRVAEQQGVAAKRTRFEEAVYQVQAIAKSNGFEAPTCFISYAWGVDEHEQWVRRQLAKDLLKAGIKVVLDEWHNKTIGANIAHFVERVEKCGAIIVVGTPLYLHKYGSKEGSVGAAEVDLVNRRMLGSEADKETVKPVLLKGKETESLPPLLRGRVRANFCVPEDYFSVMFDLIVSLYDIPFESPAVQDLRDHVHDRLE